MTHCRLCLQPPGGDWLDFGYQPLQNRYLRAADEPEPVFPLTLGVCGRCGVVQLGAVAPAEEIRPRFDWITYNEPERHLDEAARLLATLPGVSGDSTFCGLTYKDESTLRRLRAMGFAKTWLADRRDDLGIAHPLGGIESVQQAMTVATARRLAAERGRPDVVLFRHVLEHAQDVHAVLAGLRELVAPGGHVVFEVPDATRALERCDYSTVWEEHVFYFTPFTLRRAFELTGFEVVALEEYVYTLENSLVAVVRPADRPTSRPPATDEVARELGRARRFVREYLRVRDRHRGYFAEASRRQGRVALLGAGHLSAAYINLLGLADFVDCVADDSPSKQGLFMPGSRAPILGSAALLERGIGLCLMTVRPEVEDAVARRNAAFTARGGRLASIFPDSPYGLRAA